MEIKYGKNAPEMIKIRADLFQKKIKSEELLGDEQDQKPALIINAIEARDHAELIFLIMRHDVQFMRDDKAAYVQAKLTAVPDEDESSNGKGVAETSLIIYNVDSEVSDNSDDRKKLANVPKKNTTINFYLN